LKNFWAWPCLTPTGLGSILEYANRPQVLSTKWSSTIFSINFLTFDLRINSYLVNVIKFNPNWFLLPVWIKLYTLPCRFVPKYGPHRLSIDIVLSRLSRLPCLGPLYS
jgi:hypothetical protein